MASANTPNQIKPPALPQAPQTWDRRFHDQYSNVLRLFFNALDNALNSLMGENSGGAALYSPHVTFYSSTTQTPSGANVKQTIFFENLLDSALGITIDGGANTDISVQKTGYYSFRMTLQVESTTGVVKEVTAWVAINGVDVPFSAQLVSFNKAGNSQLAYGFSLVLTASDVVTFHWATTSINAQLESRAPSPPYPGISSAIVSITYASNVLI